MGLEENAQGEGVGRGVMSGEVWALGSPVSCQEERKNCKGRTGGGEDTGLGTGTEASEEEETGQGPGQVPVRVQVWRVEGRER